MANSQSKVIGSFIGVVLTLCLFYSFSPRGSDFTLFASKHLHFGVLAVDIANQDTLLNSNGQKLFIPASNSKLYSFYISTQILQNDSIVGIEYHLEGDTLFVQPTGDPTFLNPEYGEQRVFDFLREHGKIIVFDDNVGKINRFGKGWQIGDIGNSYLPELVWLPIYGNKVKIFPKEKKVFPKLFTQNILWDTLSRREINENRFIVDTRKDSLKFFFRLNNTLLKKFLEDTLHKKVEFRNIDSLKSKVKFKPLYSQPADSLYRRVLQESDNFITEQLFVYHYRSYTDSVSYRNFFKKLSKKYFDDFPTKIQYVDASGISRYNLTSPMNTVYLLNKIAQDSTLFNKTLRLLPQFNKSGTLKDEFESDDIVFYAKSGTLRNNYCLSGYLFTKKGNTIAVSIMVNHFLEKKKEITSEIEKILLHLSVDY